MAVLLVYVVAIALAYGAYRIIRNGFRYSQSEKLNFFGVFGYFLMILVGIWLLTTLAHRLF
jgi:prolipoprotein diacylglyceryltransferase